MNPRIKAIETEYQDYRMRSRTEARWAVFFDALGWQWEYEREGYELVDGKRYLPDFYLPKFKLHVEIKGEIDQVEPTIERLVRFVHETPTELLLIVGQPAQEKMFYLDWGSIDSCIQEFRSSGGLVPELLMDHINTCCRVEFGSTPRSSGIEFIRVRQTPYDVDDLNDAYRAAKQARFEFGEFPKGGK